MSHHFWKWVMCFKSLQVGGGRRKWRGSNVYLFCHKAIRGLQSLVGQCLASSRKYHQSARCQVVWCRHDDCDGKGNLHGLGRLGNVVDGLLHGGDVVSLLIGDLLLNWGE